MCLDTLDLNQGSKMSLLIAPGLLIHSLPLSRSGRWVEHLKSELLILWICTSRRSFFWLSKTYHKTVVGLVWTRFPKDKDCKLLITSRVRRSASIHTTRN